MMNDIFRFLFGAMIGAVFIFSGVFGWRKPSIRQVIRKTKHGETINKIAMISVGIEIIIGAFVLAFF
ncbi:MAG: hypothetical protein IJO83_07255 [Clostridia bacterium]|nr:hypothetical protein [Clostridia bacterium]